MGYYLQVLVKNESDKCNFCLYGFFWPVLPGKSMNPLLLSTLSRVDFPTKHLFIIFSYMYN